MLRRTALIGLIAICLTILGFTFMVRDSLCELQIKDGQTVFLAKLAYEVK
ncbi:Hok/Gef family protein [Photobacterium damselae]|nr:Hok/Gef family protein [Photobacterium damselae]ELV7517778.1 Hok/Gef family protein [Photobacterium damselae]KAB1511987.1 Hok/Gef family protein [Photobacterium damselae subsp. damselae]TLS69583.1 Hok/Gef family protein [Photobacterium damselae subsp. damselae]TLS74577.1 Hok/Gef family protein [Photobacterium damselae subsp. damselae]TLS84140.1 Hok/Gef family protein [Photobacterium damselae subsp. damselae]